MAISQKVLKEASKRYKEKPKTPEQKFVEECLNKRLTKTHKAIIGTNVCIAYNNQLLREKDEMIAKLVAVLKPIQFGDKSNTCWECHAWGPMGHKDTCSIGNAIKEAEEMLK